MKAPREIKRAVAMARCWMGKPNGVVRWLWDDWRLHNKMLNSKNLYRRCRVNAKQHKDVPT